MNILDFKSYQKINILASELGYTLDEYLSLPSNYGISIDDVTRNAQIDYNSMLKRQKRIDYTLKAGSVLAASALICVAYGGYFLPKIIQQNLVCTRKQDEI